MRVARPRVTFADLQQWPDDGKRYELYDGEVCEVPGPTPRHQVAAQNVYDFFRAYQRSHGGRVLLSPIDIVFSEFDVIQPDVLFFGHARAHLIEPDRATRHPPDLIVEVLSPGTETTDRGKKMRMLVRYKVPEYWLVDARARVCEVYRLSGDAYVLEQTASDEDTVSSRILPDLAFPAREIFGDW